MANNEAVNNAIEKATPAISLKDLIEKSSKELGRALPSHLSPERLVRIALTTIRLNPELQKCTPESFLGALFVSAQLGIEPIAGRAYLLPFNNKRKIGNEWKSFKEVQFVMGYKGLAELFYRHEKAVQLDWGIVHENDDFRYEYGTNAYLKHIPAQNDPGVAIGYYVIAKLNGGGRPFMYMNKTDCLEHGKKHSKTYDKNEGKFYASSPWATSEDSMCLKTVLIQLAKLLPLSVEMQRALEADETSREYRTGIDNALDIPADTTWDKEPEKEKPFEPEKMDPKKEGELI